MPVEDEKSRLRSLARRRRDAAARVAGPGIADALRDNFVAVMAEMGLPAGGKTVGGYWPLAGEMDVRVLLSHLHGAGFVCALPVVVAPDAPLVLRRWVPGARLEEGRFGTRQPGADAPAVRPDVVLAPLLAFDAAGHRLGRGGGYYDRTLAALRGAGPLLAVGIAYAAQQVDSVPHTGQDQRLDWVVTEEKAIRCG